MAGARLRPVALHPPAYEADVDALAALVNDRTRLLLLNTPHNPTGKVFTAAELEAIARVCVEHDLIAVTDEVYEHLVFDGEHRPLCTFPGMAERTLTISSAGKTFSFTGWKIGWVMRPRGAGHRGAHRQAVPHLRERRAVPTGGRGGTRAGRRLLRAALRHAAATSATSSATACAPPASRCSSRRARTSPPSTSDPSVATTASSSAARSRSAAAWWRCRAPCSTRIRPPVGTSSASRSASASRSSPRPPSASPPWREPRPARRRRRWPSALADLGERALRRPGHRRRRTSEHRRRVRLLHPRGRPGRRVASPEWRGPLVVRLLPSPSRAPQAAREAAVQGWAAERGYTAPACPRGARCRRWVRPPDAGDGTGTRHDDARGGQRQAVAGAPARRPARHARAPVARAADRRLPARCRRRVVDHRLEPAEAGRRGARPARARGGAPQRRGARRRRARRPSPWCATATSIRST